MALEFRKIAHLIAFGVGAAAGYLANASVLQLGSRITKAVGGFFKGGDANMTKWIGKGIVCLAGLIMLAFGWSAWSSKKESKEGGAELELGIAGFGLGLIIEEITAAD